MKKCYNILYGDNMKQIKSKLGESIYSILPIMIIMIIVSILLKFSIVTIVSILVSTIFLIIGISLFTYGADISMIEIGKSLASSLVKTKKPLLIAFVTLFIGIIITVAEPDLKVLATQMTAIDNTTLILCVGLGVGIFLALASLRIIYQIDLKVFIVTFYGLILLLMLFASESMIPVSFDSGGVTTGPMSVPFIIAMGIGFSKSRSRKESKDDSFGLVAMCSIGPILIVLLFSLLFKGDMVYEYNILAETKNFANLFSSYTETIVPTLKEVGLSLLPILLLFGIFDLITKKIKKNKLKQVIIGLIITYIGLSLFFIGVNAGYMKIAYLIGIKMFANYEYLLIPLGIIVGLVIVKAEPAVAVLTSQIEKMTQGSVSRRSVNNIIAFGVSIAIAISIARVLTGISIVWFLLIGYILAVLLTFVTPKIFTMIAFDSGGAVSGPMTTSFLLPLIIGICYQKGGNVMTDAFGLVALVALSPLLTIQLFGLIYSIKSKQVIDINTIDESIVEYNWRCLP